MIAALAASTSAQGTATWAAGSAPSISGSALPSFNCANAISARETAICGDPALSVLDGQLGRLYRERSGLLSPQGAKLLQESERSWLRFVGVVCSRDDPGKKPWLNKTFCLKRQYNVRISQLQTTVQKIGPFIFNRIDLYAARPSDEETGSATGFYIQHTSYPQIDNSLSPDVLAWNRTNVRSLPTDGDCGPGDYDNDYEVGFANARFVSLSWTESTYCHGTAHGFHDIKSANTILTPSLRSLTARDLFAPGEGWRSALKERFWNALTQTGWRPPDNQPLVKQELESAVTQPGRWLFTKEGLQVAFVSYEGGCYACTPQPVTLPWSELKPLLSKTAVAP